MIPRELESAIGLVTARSGFVPVLVPEAALPTLVAAATAAVHGRFAGTAEPAFLAVLAQLTRQNTTFGTTKPDGPYTTKAAAARLGVSPDALRRQLERDEANGVERPDYERRKAGGRWEIYFP